jgi:peptidase E
MGSNWQSARRQVIFVPFRTDNEVKNHFYSILRKALRKINRVIVDELKK